MIVTHALEMDLSRRGITPRIDVVQDDKYSRDLAISLYSLGKPWAPGRDVEAVIRYAKSDGTGGVYNLLPDGTPAWRIEGNLVTIALAPQVCTAAGQVDLVVSLKTWNAQISSFLIELNVQRNPVFQAASEDYINDDSVVPAFGWEPGKFLGTDDEGNVVAVDLPECDVQTVNGVSPDENGNIHSPCSGIPKPDVAKIGQYLRVKSVDAQGMVTSVEAVHLDGDAATSITHNGHTLPDLPPEIAAFPYRFVIAMEGNSLTAYYAYGMSVKPWVHTETLGGQTTLSTKYFGINGGKVSARYATCSPSSTDWLVLPDTELEPRVALEGYLYHAPGLIWSNIDVIDTDGTVLFPGSNPVQSSGLPHIRISTLVSLGEDGFELSPEDAARFMAAHEQKTPVICTFTAAKGDSTFDYSVILFNYTINEDSFMYANAWHSMVDSFFEIVLLLSGTAEGGFGLLLPCSDLIGSHDNPGSAAALPHITVTYPVEVGVEATLCTQDCEKFRSAAEKNVPVVCTFNLLVTEINDTVTIHLAMDHLQALDTHQFTRDFRLPVNDNKTYVATVQPLGSQWRFLVSTEKAYT